LEIVVTAFVLASIIYGIFVAPKITSAIARTKSLDKNKWFLSTIIFNIFAIVYLWTLLDTEQSNEKRALLMLVVIYIGIFVGAFLIDAYTSF
jgi:hypothetical protein